jgi:hypothetical protein
LRRNFEKKIIFYHHNHFYLLIRKIMLHTKSYGGKITPNRLMLFNSHCKIKYPSVRPLWIKPFKLLMGAKISTNNHSTVPLSRIMYLKNITVKLYMRGANLAIFWKITGHLVRHYQRVSRWQISSGKVKAALPTGTQIPFSCLTTHYFCITKPSDIHNRNNKLWSRKTTKSVFGFLFTCRCHKRELPNYWALSSIFD